MSGMSIQYIKFFNVDSACKSCPDLITPINYLYIERDED